MSKYIFVKSGAWNDDPSRCCSAYRYYRLLPDRFSNLSLRLARDLKKPPHTILRGGSWIHYGRYVRSASRDHFQPGDRFYLFGLRLALTTDSVQPRRTTKGGSWFSLVGCKIRSARRNHKEPDFRFCLFGLRLALTASIEP